MPNSIGFPGSDALIEENPAVVKQLAISPVMRLAARFAIGARQSEAREVAARLRNGEPLSFATSNPRQLEISAHDTGFKLAEIFRVTGAVEASLDDDPALDAVFDIVGSGKTMMANGLEIVTDNIAPIILTGVWKNPTK